MTQEHAATLAEIHARIKNAKRIVVKIGTNALMHGGTPNKTLMCSIAAQIAALMGKGYEVIVVSSGAIGFGARALLETPPIQTLAMRQACAAVGQPYLLASYEQAFGAHGILCAQLLLTRANFTNEQNFRAVKSCLSALLAKKVVPIINENDSVATEEIETRIFGDNDQLAAMVACHFDAELLVILSDVDAFYEKNPRKHHDAKPLKVVSKLDAYIREASQETGSSVGTGGMKTKLLAARTAGQDNCITIIAKADAPDILSEIVLKHKDYGTFFLPEVQRKNAHK